MKEVKTININQIKDYTDPIVIDIRESDELGVGKIEGSQHIPMMGLIMNKEQFLNKEDTYFIYCAAGGRSFQTCSMLASAGYNVVNLDGGYNGYQG